MARPSKLTPEVSAAILSAVRRGAGVAEAARAAGISYYTLNNWRKWGEAGKRKYLQFFNALSDVEEYHKARVLVRRATWAEAQYSLGRKMTQAGKRALKGLSVSDNPQAAKAAAALIAEGSKAITQALGIPDPARVWPLLAKYKIPLDALTPEELDAIAAGSDPIEVLIAATQRLAKTPQASTPSGEAQNE